MVTTLLTRGEQAHQSILAAHLNGTDPVYTSTLQKLTRYFAVQRGNAAGSHMAMGTLYSNLVRQATLCSYIGDFRLLGYLSLLCLPFLLFFRNKKGKQAAAAIARNRAIFARQAAR